MERTARAEVALVLGIGETYASKTIQEAESGDFVNPHHTNQARVKGDGSKSPTAEDDWIRLLQLRLANGRSKDEAQGLPPIVGLLHPALMSASLFCVPGLIHGFYTL